MTDQPKQDAIVSQRADDESDDRMTATARKNLRTFVSGATFKCRADQSAALSCIDVLEERIDGLYDLVTVLRSAIGAFPLKAEIEAATIERCVGVADSNRTDDDSMWDRAADTIATALRNLKAQTS